MIKFRNRSPLEEQFAWQLTLAKIPPPVREYKFHPERRWRFDFSWIENKLSVEIEGCIWHNGRHNRGKGYEADLEKYNEAALLGWTVLRFSAGMIKSGYALNTLAKLLFKDNLKTLL